MKCYVREDFDACFSWICTNSGTCELNENGIASCLCPSSFYGNLCQYKRLNSTVFIGSSILTDELSTQLLSLISFPSHSSFDLIYQASRDGFRASDFHSKCDGYANTLTVVKSSNGNIFGGYSSAQWGGSTKTKTNEIDLDYVDSKSNYNPAYKNDSDAFLFSLVNEYQVPAKINIVKSRSNYAIYSSNFYGPTFGTGYDLCVADQSNTNTNSYSYLGSAYQFKSSSHVKSYSSYLAGSNYFETVEVEVYHLNKKQDYTVFSLD